MELIKPQQRRIKRQRQDGQEEARQMKGEEGGLTGEARNSGWSDGRLEADERGLKSFYRRRFTAESGGDTKLSTLARRQYDHYQVQWVYKCKSKV